MTSPFLSIVIPCYNSARFIKDTLSMLLSQGLDDAEVIVVNDGSSDNTLEIAQGFSVLDARISVVSHEKNMGLPVARNTGLDAAMGKYVYFFDSDDSLTQGSLDFFRQMLSEHEGCSLFLFGYESRRKSKRDKLYVSPAFDNMELSSDLLIKSLLTKRLYAGIWSGIYERKFLVDNGFRFTHGLPMGEDVDFILRVFPFINKTFYSKRVTFLYQIRDDSMMEGYKTYNRTKYNTMVYLRSLCLEGFYQTEEIKEYSAFFIQNNLLSNIRYYLFSSFCDSEITERFCDDCSFFKMKAKSGRLFNMLMVRLARYLPLCTVLHSFKKIDPRSSVEKKPLSLKNCLRSLLFFHNKPRGGAQYKVGFTFVFLRSFPYEVSYIRARRAA